MEGIQTLHVNEVRVLGIVLCSLFAFSCVKNLRFMATWHRNNAGYGHVLVLGLRESPHWSTKSFVVLMLCLAGTLAGYAITTNRLFGAAALLLYFAIFPGIVQCNLVYAKSSLSPMVLFMLLVSTEYHQPLFYLGPADAEPGASWTLIMIRSLIAIVYLQTGVGKLLATGWRWAKGRVLQWYLLEHYLWGGFKRAVPVFRNVPLLRVMSTVTMSMQLSAPLIVLGGWVPGIHGIFALGFHISTEIFMGIRFIAFFGPVLISSAVSYPLVRLAEASLSPEQVAAYARIADAAPAGSAIWQIALMALVPAALIWHAFIPKNRFPFIHFQLFTNDYSRFKNFGALMLEQGDESGVYRPWQPFDYYDARNVSYFGYSHEDQETRLHPDFRDRFAELYWPIMRRERADGAEGVRSIRLVSRYPVWEDGIPIGYDDFAFAVIPVNGDEVGEVEPIPREHLRSHRF